MEIKDNNILIISEKEQKAYLPYKYSDVELIYRNSNNVYNTIGDVINELYVLPLEKFKYSSISRFRETFNFLYHKCKCSIVKSIDIALELMFKYDLNPIVIAAFRNLEEFDIYLDCLEEKELDKFDCFDIRFEVAPKINNLYK